MKNDDLNIFKIYYSILLENAEKELSIEKTGQTFDEKLSNLKKIEIPEEEAKEIRTRLLAAKAILRKKNPGLAFTLDNMKTVLIKNDKRINTMAVDNFRNIYIDVDFLMKELDVNTTVGVLAHEACHIDSNTFSRRKGRNMKLWNYATDYAMNLIIITGGLKLPTMGLIPEKIYEDFYITPKSLGLKKGNWKIKISGLRAEDIYRELYKKLGDSPPQPPPPQPPPPQPPQDTVFNVGDIMYDKKSKQYGIVKDIDYKLGDVEFDNVSKDEALKLAKEQSRNIFFKDED